MVEARMRSSRTSRRRFLQTTAAAGGALAFGVHSWPVRADESQSPNEKLNIAAIGTYNRAQGNIDGVASQNIVALCDIDEQFLARAAERFPKAKRYADFRVLLD